MSMVRPSQIENGLRGSDRMGGSLSTLHIGAKSDPRKAANLNDPRSWIAYLRSCRFASAMLYNSIINNCRIVIHPLS